MVLINGQNEVQMISALIYYIRDRMQFQPLPLQKCNIITGNVI